MQMHDHVADLETRVFDRRRRPVAGARERPDERVCAGLEHAPRLAHHLGEPRHPLVAPALVLVPCPAHEADPGRRVGDDSVDRRVGEFAEFVETVAVNQMQVAIMDGAFQAVS